MTPGIFELPLSIFIENPQTFLFFVSWMLFGGFINWFWRNVNLDKEKQNPLNNKYYGVLLWGLLVNILTIFWYTKSLAINSQSVLYFGNLGNLWITLVFTISLCLLGKLLSKYGWKVIKEIVIHSFVMLFLIGSVIAGWALFISALSDSTKNIIEACPNTFCKTTNILGVIFSLAFSIWFFGIVFAIIKKYYNLFRKR